MSDLFHTTLPAFLPLVIAITLVTSGLWLLHYLLLTRHDHLTGEQKLPRQLSLLILTLIGLVVIAVTLPVSEGTRNQIIGLIGVLASGVIAFSSTTIVSNLMAGLVLRVNRPFRVGDFIRVNEHSGRVAEMGLLDTEIQTETRELIAFANTLMVNNPVSVVRASGAIVSVDLSLGYDIHHSVIEKHLLAGAESAGLEEPFVQVIALGDFAVTYRVAGLLKDVKSLLSARSRLHKAVLDSLHQADIEIVSPSFMNQRPQPEGLRMIPPQQGETSPSPDNDTTPETVMFDKAEEAESTETEREQLQAKLDELEERLSSASGDDKASLTEQRDKVKARLASVVKKSEEEKERR
ncbi:mechanosensitive ion channel family protein [Alteromonas sp. CYL-A6]|uniref:mechanosensitive ion channel family protein n=1 Tax=Alteromonas nitratireducens TaxID=3390813 RepID=UPI0034B5F9F1